MTSIEMTRPGRSWTWRSDRGRGWHGGVDGRTDTGQAAGRTVDATSRDNENWPSVGALQS